MDFLRLHRISVLIFALAVIVRLIFAWPLLLTPNPSPELLSADGYYEIAHNLLEGNGFSRSATPPIVPDSVRMPLYTLIIAGVVWLTGSYKAFLVLQVFIGSTIPLLGKKLAELITKEQQIAYTVGIFLAVEPLLAWLPGILLTETFFTVFFLIACITFFLYLREEQRIMLLTSAIFFGLATLMRPTTQFLPIALVLFLLLLKRVRSRREWAGVALFLATFLLILSPWIYRNYEVFGKPALNVQSASILYAFFVPSVIALEQHISFSEAQKQFTGSDNIGGIDDVDIGNASSYRSRALEELRKHPIGIMKSLGVTFLAFFTNDGYRTFTGRYDALAFDSGSLTASQALHHPGKLVALLLSPGALLIILGRLMWIVITLLAFAGGYLLLKQRRERAEIVAALLIICYFVATTAIVGLGVNGRFRIPVDALILTFASFALFQIINTLKEYCARYQRRTT